MNDTTPPDRATLLDFALDQHGYFTWSQARDCGYSAPLISHHASRGGFERVRRGIYRFPDIPRFEREPELTAWLAAGKADSVLSHETALELLGLGDVIPDRIHLLVSRSRRGYRGSPRVQIHTTTRALRAEERTSRRGMSLTSPSRSIMDAAEFGTHPDQIAAAIREAVEKGMTTAERLLTAAAEKNRRVRNLVRDTLGE